MAKRKTTTRRKKPAKKAASRAPKPVPPTPTPGPGEQLWILDVPYEMRAVAQACGAKWDKRLKANIFIGTDLHPGLAPFAAPDLSWQQWQQDDLSGTHTSLPGDGTITPRPHQEEAADLIRSAFTLERPGVLIADDVGLGKTISTWSGVLDLHDAKTVLIVCPIAVVAHWRRTIKSMGTGNKRVCVINYEKLRHLLSVPKSADAAKRTRTKNKRIAEQGKSLVDWDIVIADEAHKMKNPQSQRSMAGRRVSNSAFTIWLSATAGTTPLDLSYLAPLLGEVTGSPVTNLDEFEHWCQGQGIGVKRGDFGKWEWEKNEDDLDLMQSVLFNGDLPAGIRRQPENIAGWPSITRNPHPIAFDADARRLYKEAWTEFRREMELAQRGNNPSNGLAAQTRFRQKASLLRVPGVIDLVQDFLDNGRQVAVSVAWIETLTAIQETLGARKVPVAVIYGAQNTTEKEAERIRFQTGDARVCVFTVEEGISLHAGETAVSGNNVPRSSVIADPRWSAMSSLQIEGRTHRDGQRSDAWYCYGEDTVEERIVSTAIERMRHTKQLVGDDVETLREIEAILLAHAA